MLPRLLPVIDALCAVRVSGAINKDKTINITHALCTVELFKSITCEKLRRAPKAAVAARFFDESVRNSYARRATTPQTASWRQGEFRAEARKRSRRCVTLMRTPVASVSGAQQKGHGVKGNFAPRREKDPADASLWCARLWRALAVRNKRSSRKRCRAAVRKARRREHRCLEYKNGRSDRLSDLPLAFGLCRSAHAQARALQANNRPDFFPFIPRFLRRHIGYKGAGSGQ